MEFNLIGTNSTAYNTEVTNVRIFSEPLRCYATDNVLNDATEDVQGLLQGQKKKVARFHDQLFAKANRLGRSFDAGDLLNIFMSGIDDSITLAV